ncbi:hypothetical protein Celaphus_00001311 [Cervus elaphus hippelaphus]|uniref:Uncharacterized protein n=1 Tax=Cervus elaphus hippelaphus TaxID=46360 RepID=A0A212DA14_CEREH|nr:hypothetical protein Celaphus_00001311 [Cervus elaphus hippelaphus]
MEPQQELTMVSEGGGSRPELWIQLLPALQPPCLLSDHLLQDHLLPTYLCDHLLSAHVLWVQQLWTNLQQIQLLPALLPPQLCVHLLPAFLLLKTSPKNHHLTNQPCCSQDKFTSKQAWAGSTRGRSSQRGRSNWIHSSSRSSSRNLRSLRSPRRPRSQIRSRRTRSSCPRSLRNPSHSHSRNRSRNRSSRSRTAGSSTLHSSLALQHSRRSSPLGSTPWSPPVRSQVRTATRAPQV